MLTRLNRFRKLQFVHLSRDSPYLLPDRCALYSPDFVFPQIPYILESSVLLSCFPSCQITHNIIPDKCKGIFYFRNYRIFRNLSAIPAFDFGTFASMKRLKVLVRKRFFSGFGIAFSSIFLQFWV